MANKIAVLLIMTFFYLIVPIYAQNKIDGWTLLWSDEFDKTTVDKSIWKVENAFLEKNNELQYYSRKDTWVENGFLHLRSQKRNYRGKKYTSGLVESRKKFDLRLGRVEVRAKLPKGKGIWPAHWLMNRIGQWPPEIDIMELIGHEPNTIHMTLHYDKWPNNKSIGSHFDGPDFSQDFHTYAIEWDKDKIKWFIDGIERYSVNKYVPDVPFYIVLNTAVGGDWPGSPDETTVFPQLHLIDYVRVYKRDKKNSSMIKTEAKYGEVYTLPNQTWFKNNSEISLRAVPQLGYQFQKWQGDLTSKQNPTTIKVRKNLKIKALFTPDPNPPKKINKIQNIAASTQEKPQLNAQNMIDNNRSSRWSSKFQDNQWLEVELVKPTKVQAVRIIWEKAMGRDYDILTSLDGKNWQTQAKITYNDKLKAEYLFNSPTQAKFIRIDLKKRSTHWGFSIWELELFE